MNNLVKTLVLISVLFITGMTNTFAQITIVNKLCIGQGGTITVCSGYGYGYFTCGELMSGNSSVDIEWQ